MSTKTSIYIYIIRKNFATQNLSPLNIYIYLTYTNLTQHIHVYVCMYVFGYVIVIPYPVFFENVTFFVFRK